MRTIRQKLPAASPKRVIWLSVYDAEARRAYSLLAVVGELDSAHSVIAQRTRMPVLCIRNVPHGRSHALTFVELPQRLQDYFIYIQSPRPSALVAKMLVKRGIMTPDHTLTELGEAYKQIGDALRRYADAEIGLWGACGLSAVEWD